MRGNSAERAGGGIEADGGTTVVARGRLTGNTTGAVPGNGGALHLTGAGGVKVKGSLVANNTAGAEGGGLWNSATGDFTIERTTIRDNSAAGADADQGGGGALQRRRHA